MIGENENYIYNRDRCLILEKFTWACGGKNWRHTINQQWQDMNISEKRILMITGVFWPNSAYQTL